jgi:hypothetical protein
MVRVFKEGNVFAPREIFVHNKRGLNLDFRMGFGRQEEYGLECKRKMHKP